MLKVFIRVDGSAKVGLGHLVRCMALAQMLKPGFAVCFVCIDIPEETVKEIKALQFDLLEIKSEEEFLSIIRKDNIAVLDGYGFDISYQRKIKSTGASLVCIDDMHDKPFDADLIINHAPGIVPADYDAEPTTRFALGPGFALLRPAFLKNAKKIKTFHKTETAFICFGGADGKNLTRVALEAAVESEIFKKINVVTGPAYTNIQSLQPMLAAKNNIVHHHALKAQQMFNVMAASDVAIVPASGILYEVMCAGCRVISGTYVDNQRFLFEAFQKENACISAGNFSKDEITAALDKLAAAEEKNISLVDGFSPKRVVEAFYDLKLEVRKAGMNDCKLLFDWANDPAVRSNAINKEPIVWQSHVSWLQGKLKDEKSEIFILEYAGAPAGQIRYDFDGTAWVIDYSVEKKYRGKGFGKAIIEKTLHHFKGEQVDAMVLDSNISSARTFEKTGFRPSGKKKINNRYFLVYKFLS